MKRRAKEKMKKNKKMKDVGYHDLSLCTTYLHFPPTPAPPPASLTQQALRKK